MLGLLGIKAGYVFQSVGHKATLGTKLFRELVSLNNTWFNFQNTVYITKFDKSFSNSATIQNITAPTK